MQIQRAPRNRTKIHFQVRKETSDFLALVTNWENRSGPKARVKVRQRIRHIALIYGSLVD